MILFIKIFNIYVNQLIIRKNALHDPHSTNDKQERMRWPHTIWRSKHINNKIWLRIRILISVEKYIKTKYADVKNCIRQYSIGFWGYHYLSFLFGLTSLYLLFVFDIHQSINKAISYVRLYLIERTKNFAYFLCYNYFTLLTNKKVKG